MCKSTVKSKEYLIQIFGKSMLLSDAIGTNIWVYNDSGNGLLPDGTKPLSEPMLTYHQQG